MPRRYRVAVVGAGVGGTTTAYLLASAGHSIDLFERAPRLAAVGAGVLLQPSGQLVLDRLGLLEEVLRQGEPIDELHALTHRGHTRDCYARGALLAARFLAGRPPGRYSMEDVLGI